MKASQIEELAKLLSEDLNLSLNVAADDQTLLDIKQKVEQAGFRGFFWVSPLNGKTLTITNKT